MTVERVLVVKNWHVSKGKGDISPAMLYKHRVRLIKDLKLPIWQKIEVSPMLGFMHRTSTTLCIKYYT